MLYEALAGRSLPSSGETASAIVVNACTRQHAPLETRARVPQNLARFVDRCLSKEPTGRPRDGAQMLAELRQVRSGVSAAGGASMGVAPTMGIPAMGLHSGQGTGPLGGTGAPMTPAPVTGSAPGFTPSGTAYLPAGGGSAPGGFGNPPVLGSAPGYQTGPPQPGFGGGFGSTPGSAPGLGGFASQPGSAPGMPPGSFVSTPGAYSTMGGAPAKKSGGLGVWVIAAALLGALFVVGAAIGVVVWAVADSDPKTEPCRSKPTSARASSSSTAARAGRWCPTNGSSSRRDVMTSRSVRRVRRLRSRRSPLPKRESTPRCSNRTAPVANNNGIPNNGIPPGPPLNTVQVFTGQLRPTDTRLPDGKYADTSYYQWVSGTRIRIEADSNDFDTYLMMRTPSGRQMTNDDREPGNLNAAIDTTLTESGRYEVIVTSFSPNQTGDYTLTLRTP